MRKESFAMATISYENALQMAESLPREEQLRLIQELAQHAEDSAEGKTSVLELCGLGQEIWQQLDAQQYVRAAWNG
jgi:hypothetical protein